MKNRFHNSLPLASLLALWLATFAQAQQKEEPQGFALPEAGVKSVMPAVQVEMEMNEQRVLSWPFDVTRVFLADDSLLKLEPVTPSKLRLRALKSGKTRVNVWGQGGNTQTYEVLIHAPIAELKKVFKAIKRKAMQSKAMQTEAKHCKCKVELSEARQSEAMPTNTK